MTTGRNIEKIDIVDLLILEEKELAKKANNSIELQIQIPSPDIYDEEIYSREINNLILEDLQEKYSV